MNEHKTKMFAIVEKNKDETYSILDFAEHGEDLKEKLEQYKGRHLQAFMAKHWADLSGDAIMEARRVLKEMVGISHTFFDDCVLRACQELHEFRRRHNQGKPLAIVEDADGKLKWEEDQRKAVDALFSATPAELGAAALAEASKQKE